MNNKYTLKELADMFAFVRKEALSNGQSIEGARELALKHILDAIGYELPKNAEREAFDAWCKANHKLATTDQFEAWKAGREELRKKVCSDKCEETKTEPEWWEPEWISWNGGRCPIPERTKREGLIPEYPKSELFCCVPLLSKCPIPEDTKCEVKFRNGGADIGPAKRFDWDHVEESHDIIAYRILDSAQCRDTKTEPAWIPWYGGDKSPIVGKQTRYEVECRNGVRMIWITNFLRWSHDGTVGDIMAYRILD